MPEAPSRQPPLRDFLLGARVPPVTTRCPQCQSREVRVHGSVCELTFVRRWRFLGRIVPRIGTVALECSCSKCLYAFIAREDGTSPAPRQDAYDQLRNARSLVGPDKNGGEPQRREPTPMPRPAPDPRALKRR